MNGINTAIIHLHRAGRPAGRRLLQPMLSMLRGVREARYEPADRLITVQFDNRHTSLADLVRLIEEAGSIVAGVALRI